MSSPSGCWDYPVTPDSATRRRHLTGRDRRHRSRTRSSFAHQRHEMLRQAWSVERSRALLDGPGPAFDETCGRRSLDLGWPDVLVSEPTGAAAGPCASRGARRKSRGGAAPVPAGCHRRGGMVRGPVREGAGIVLHRTGDHADRGRNCLGHVRQVVPYGVRRDPPARPGRGRRDDSCWASLDPAGPGVTAEPLTPLDHNPAARITLEAARST